MIYLLIASLQANTHVGGYCVQTVRLKAEALAWDIGIFMDDC